jgi:hypothetical protein
MSVTRPQPEEALENLLGSLTGQRKEDALTICALMQEASGDPPVLWGTSIIGFGAYHYKYESGHEGDAPIIAFSPRSKSFSLYMTDKYPEYPQLLAKLGKHKMSGSCLHITKLTDIDRDVLKEMIAASFKREKSPGR